MAEFKRSRLIKKSEDEITRKTVVLGLVTVVFFVLLLVFGLPLLIKLSVVLGNLRSNNKTVVQEKTLPPPAPRIVLPFEATNTGQINIEGYSENGLTVELMKNGSSLGKTTADDQGDFGFSGVSLDNGDNVFTAVAEDNKGTNSDQSQPVIVNYDNQPPVITMINPSEDSLSVDSPDFDVVGKTDKGISVTINSRIALVDDQGRFKLKFQLSPGMNNLDIVATDLAGNQTDHKIQITYND